MTLSLNVWLGLLCCSSNSFKLLPFRVDLESFLERDHVAFKCHLFTKRLIQITKMW